MKKLMFLFNPHAGKGKITGSLPKIIDRFTKAGYLVTTYPTQDKGDACEKIAMLGSGFDRIVVSGGDGMLHEAVNGMMRLQERPELGYLPSGTVNDFARTHRIPKTIDKAMGIAEGETSRAIDFGTFNGEYFTYVAAFGLGTEISYTTDQNLKNMFGSLAYFMNAAKYIDIRTFFNDFHDMQITTDDATYEGRFIFGAVSNSKTIGGFRQVVPKDAEMDDGLLEGLFIRKPSSIMELDLLRSSLLKGNLDNPLVISTHSSGYRITSKEPAAWTLDGEDGGQHSKISIEDHRRILSLLLT